MPKTPDMARLRTLCPDYPETLHWTDELDTGQHWLATEKLDGANAALFLDRGQLHIRNRTHILRRGYHKDTPAKAQFVPLWAWAQAHTRAIEAVERRAGEPIVIHGEWLWALHGGRYTQLPTPFIAFAVSRQQGRTTRFIDPGLARVWLQDAGLQVPHLVGEGAFDRAWLDDRVSSLGTELAEGVVLACGNGRDRTLVAKWIRPGYEQNGRWNPERLVRQGSDTN